MSIQTVVILILIGITAYQRFMLWKLAYNAEYMSRLYNAQCRHIDELQAENIRLHEMLEYGDYKDYVDAEVVEYQDYCEE